MLSLVAHAFAGPGFGEFKTDYESIFERLSRAKSGSVRCAVVDHGNPSGWHGAKASTTVGCKTDEDVFSGLLEVIPSHNFVFGRFTSVASASGCKYELLTLSSVSSSCHRDCEQSLW